MTEMRDHEHGITYARNHPNDCIECNSMLASETRRAEALKLAASDIGDDPTH